MGCFRNVGIGTGIVKDLKILVFVFGIVKGHFKVLVLGIVLRTFMNIGIGWKYWVLVLEKSGIAQVCCQSIMALPCCTK